MFIPFSQHLAGLNESISLRSLVACHFVWFQLEPDAHYRLVAGRNERFREPLASLSYSPENPPFESRRRSQTITGQGEICIGIYSSERPAPGRHDNCHRGRSICGLTPTVLHEQRKRPPEVFQWYYGAFQRGNRPVIVRVKNEPPGLSSPPGVCDVWVT